MRSCLRKKKKGNHKNFLTRGFNKKGCYIFRQPKKGACLLCFKKDKLAKGPLTLSFKGSNLQDFRLRHVVHAAGNISSRGF